MKFLVVTPPSIYHNVYSYVTGIMLYLYSNIRTYISFAVHQCAYFTHKIKASHENAVKKILRYLKGITYKVLVFSPSDRIEVSCYLDAYFAVFWVH